MRFVAIALVVAALVAVWVAGTLHDGRTTTRKTATRTGTAEVVRGDLVDTVTVDGTLGYPTGHALVAARTGVLTWLPAAGSIVTQGHALYQVARSPVVLLYGRLPLYRTLRSGVADGPDVKQLERALTTLGHGAGLTVDDHFSAATAQAVSRWQRAERLPRTGAVDAGQVVFHDGPLRVGAVRMAPGDVVAPGRPVLVATGTRRTVHVDLDTAEQSLAAKGRAATVTLPDGIQAAGRISSVGAVAHKKPGSTQGATIDVDIMLNKPAGALDQAPVTVTLESEQRHDVLTVPIEALLAIGTNGYGIALLDHRIIPVTAGGFGGGRVEVSGPGLVAGMKVEVPE